MSWGYGMLLAWVFSACVRTSGTRLKILSDCAS
ncbi:MAG: hypothetical protein PUP92_14530 [Rhizonema sp. PD38]|nr:hypothetical protein [Rhizonema sp. PD38]